MTSPAGGRRSSFVVRVLEDRQGQVSGVIERVATGAKVAFNDLAAIGPVIREMLGDKRPGPQLASGPRRRPIGPPAP
jgi:hypothetical protein